jgi:DNA-binding transcriptional ArsR family regulator
MAKAKSGWSRGLEYPIYAETGSDSAFWFSPDAEAVFAAEGILSAVSFSLYSAVFGDEKIEYYRMKYKMISEIFSSLSNRAGLPGVFECLQGFDIRYFTLASFTQYILTIDKTKLPGILLDIPVSRIEDLTQDNQELFNNYLGAATYFAYTQDFAKGILTLAKELQTDQFYNTLDRYRRNIEQALKSSAEALAVKTPLEYSDELMRKNMWRREPCSFFSFAPTVFISRRSVRYFGSEQHLFFAIEDATYDNDIMLRQLKALADDTRFRIVALLKERGCMQGSDIAHTMGVSASTVSHHMRILRQAGLLHEESDGAIKYYSLPTDLAQSIIKALADFLA